MAAVLSNFLLNVALLFLLIPSSLCAEKIGFPSGATLSVHEGNAPQFNDNQLTDSKLFRVGDEGVTDSKRLTLSIDVGSFREKSSVYFRAHPVFMMCVQKAWSEVQNTGRKIELKQGYKLTTGSSKQDIYSRAGTGVRLGFASSETRKSFSLIAVALLRHCPALFGPLGRDLGLVLEPDSIFAFMTGRATPSKWSIETQGDNPDFKTITTDLRRWARERMNEVTQPKVPKCSAEVPEINEGETLPAGASLAFVGPPDRPVRRATAAPDLLDFLRLVQFPSDNLAFSVPRNEAATCPAEGGYLGNGPTTRCGPRLVAPRLFLCLNRLQRLVREQLKAKLTVSAGWAADADGLRAEGREVRVRTGSAAILGKVARLASCAGCDYVRRGKEELQLAVAKQFSLSSSPVAFPSSELLPVAVRQSEWLENYQLRSEFDSSDFPLLDGKLLKNVSDGVPLSLFASKEAEVRYLRLHPAMVKCFTEILRWENRRLNSPSPTVSLKVTQAFMSGPQEKSLMSPLIDDRLDTHTLGIGLQLAYEKPSAEYNVWRLAQTVASVCPLVFKTQEGNVIAGQSIGIGIYKKDVHIDMRYEMKVWYECEECSWEPPGGTSSFRSALLSLASLSAGNRLVDPSDLEVACKFDDPPSLQSANYKYKETEAVKRVRRATSGSPECQMNAPMDTFCRQSLEARKAEVDKVWKIITYKHLAVPKAKLLEALRGCLLSCSKCPAGPQWDSKMAHCSNLVHWVPFAVQNAATNVRSNLFPSGDKDAERRACESGEHCVELSPLVALFSDSLLARFRPDRNKPNSELVYDPVSNPSPLPVLIRKIYAFSARGEVKVFVRSEADVVAMASSLKALFLYNKAVTKVRLFVLDRSALNVVVAALEAKLEEWRTTGCPKTSRVSLTPYSAEAAPQVASEAAAYRERHLVRDLWENWSAGVQRSDML